MSIEHEDDEGAEFDAAFDDDDLPGTDGDDTSQAVTNDELDEDSTDTPNDATDDEPAADATDDEPAADATDDEPAADDDLSDVPEEDQQAYKSWRGRLRKQEQELRERENALPPVDATDDEPAEDATDDEPAEDEDIKTFLEDFPEMEVPVKKMIQKAVDKATAPVLDNVTKLTADQEKQQLEQHVATIQARHEDYGEIVESGVLEGWIDNLPYKNAVKFKTVCKSGTAPEVIEMLDRYKQDNRKEQKQDELSRHRSSQRQAGAAIPNHSSRVVDTTGNADPNDFDAGWAEAE